MDNPSVTYTGEEVALLVALIASGLQRLNRDDYEVADLMLERALAALHRPLAPDLEARLAALRFRPDLKENTDAPLSDRGRVHRGWLRRLLGGRPHRPS